MTAILSIILGLLVLGILVFIHELGHFLMAKWFGFNVLAFSLGFGKPILKKTYKGTEYRISSIPFGGYVKMEGENPEEPRKGSPGEFSSKPVYQRALVAIAGPAANFISAIFMLWIVFMWGIDKPTYYDRPIIGAVKDSSVAESAGLLAGDSIISINKKSVSSWEEIEGSFAQQEQEYTIVYSRDGEQKTAMLRMENSDGSIPENPTGGVLPALPAIVAEVNSGSSAEEAGMRAGDTVLFINGQKIFSWFQLMDIISENKEGNPLLFVVKRGEETVTMQITPRFDKQTGRNLIGVRVSEGEVRKVRYAPGAAFQKGLEKSWEYTTMIFDVIGKMASRKVSANNLSGPLGIIPVSGFLALQGISQILNFMALIGINLAVLNLLPLVITDGGLLLFLLIEAIRRKPLQVKTQMVINKIAIAFFLLLFLFVTINDVKRIPDYLRLFGR